MNALHMTCNNFATIHVINVLGVIYSRLVIIPMDYLHLAGWLAFVVFRQGPCNWLAYMHAIAAIKLTSFMYIHYNLAG